MDTLPEPLTLTLRAAHAGDRQAADRAYAALYPELLKIARARLRAHQPDTLLNTQALVHESFLRFIGGQKIELQDRRHFFTYAAKMMRNIVTDFARRKHAERRGGDLQRVTLDTGRQGAAANAADAADLADVLDIERLLAELEALDPRLAQVVEMRYFGGFADEDIALALDCSDRSVRRYWDKARAFLLVRLGAT
jgi:RNA polymerase sigma factor (TIGR02999 family)